MKKEELIRAALKARERAYTPYSQFMVGAALLSKSGKIYQGCNIENASYTPTICAERNAFFKAVYEGERNFQAIAIAGGPKDGKMSYAAPCGVCRQVMREFCVPEEFKVYIAKSEDDFVEKTLEELLPMGFGPSDLGKSL